MSAVLHRFTKYANCTIAFGKVVTAFCLPHEFFVKYPFSVWHFLITLVLSLEETISKARTFIFHRLDLSLKCLQRNAPNKLMELFQLRTFKEVAETLNFTKASENLYLTQSAVSHQIKALEEELGVRLFVRGKGGVKLTDSGKVALGFAARILKEAQRLQDHVSEREDQLVGRVRVAAATQALVHLFAPLFEEFMDATPSVDLLFRTTVSTDQTIDDILNGVADIGFASLPVYSPNLEVKALFEDELKLVSGPKHAFSNRKEVTVSELENERWILFERGASIRRETDSFFKTVGAEPEMALESNDTYFVKLMIEHGLGISLIPSWAVKEEVKAGRLTCSRIADTELKRSVAMVSLKKTPSAPISAFREFIIKNQARLQEFAS